MLRATVDEGRVVRRVHDPDRLRRSLEGGEEVTASLCRVVDRDRLTGEEQREVEVLLHECLRAESLRELSRLGLARVAALPQCDEAACDGGREEHRDAGEQDAQAAVRAAGSPCLLLGGVATLGHEVLLELVELGGVVGAPVEGRCKACAAVELAGIAPGRSPLRRRLGDVPAQPAPFRVLLDPLAQPRPLAQQGLVGDLDGALADGDEAALGQRREHIRRRVVALEVELGERRPAAYRSIALAFPDQAQHQGAHDRLPLVRDPPVRPLGQARDGTLHAAGLPVDG